MMRSVYVRALCTAPLALLMIGCQQAERNAPAAAAAGAIDTVTEEPGIPLADRKVVVFLGTSLTAGLGLLAEDAYPAVIQEKIDSAGLPFHVVNAGVSGETSAAARRRIDWLLRQKFDVLVIETGANDMLRGTDVATTRANIEAIVERVREEKPDARIVLAGMLAAPNLGREYVTRFRAMYPEMAAEYDLPLIPFVLQDVAGVRSMNQGDGMHPNVQGAQKVAENVWPVLEPVLREESAAPSPAP
ncbi:MAG: arylesterase [Gemmatimonadetes bacterium]|nr:arylesterase [Gemmatimonadota bacterium]